MYNMNKSGTIIIGGVIGLTLLIVLGIFLSDTEEKIILTDASLRVAFIGDQGTGPGAFEVLNLIKDEEANLVLHQGDFDYEDDPNKWDSMISNVLGDDFPLVATIGNHDVKAWNGYQKKLYDRLEKNPDMVCTGNLGIKSSCTYKGLFFIQIAPGIGGEELHESFVPTEYDKFIEEQLNNTDSAWRICSWHYDMNIMQKYLTSNENEWEIYDACKNGGAIIANAHKHFYSRTKTLIDIPHQVVDPEWTNPDKVRVKEGATFVFISGLGGGGIHSENTGISGGLFTTRDSWGSIYTTDQDATHGALFCTFNSPEQLNKAFCYFKNIDGKIIDEFTVTNFVSADISN